MNNSQLVVRHNANAEVFAWLEKHGYRNVQQLTVENYIFPVIVVDTKEKIFFGTNTTCMAVRLPKVYELDEIKSLL